METKNIETFFLSTLLRICIAGVSLIFLSNIFLFPEDTLSISISIAILAASIASYLLRRKYPTISVMTVTSVAIVAMIYQRLMAPNTSTTLSVVLIVGFIFSVMLKGRIMWIMHGLVFAIINSIFILHLDDAVTAAITYSTLYFILTYATGVLKFNYDTIHLDLSLTNLQLNEKANEIARQNEELLRVRDNLSTLNLHLEKIVNERTAKIQIQNEVLIKYSYTNAHHLRGPVARLLGLGSIYELDMKSEPDFIIEKMVQQAIEIDTVIQQINTDLESGNVKLK